MNVIFQTFNKLQIYKTPLSLNFIYLLPAWHLLVIGSALVITSCSTCSTPLMVIVTIDTMAKVKKLVIVIMVILVKIMEINMAPEAPQVQARVPSIHPPNSGEREIGKKFFSDLSYVWKESGECGLQHCRLGHLHIDSYIIYIIYHISKILLNGAFRIQFS